MPDRSDAARLLSEVTGMSFENAFHTINRVDAPQVVRPGHTFLDRVAFNKIVNDSMPETIKIFPTALKR